MKVAPRSPCWLYFAVSMLIPGIAAAATAYRWTDADGVVHYEQTPPGNGHYDTVHPELPRPGVAPSDDGAKAFLKRIDEQDSARTKAREAAAVARQAKAQQCAEARARLQFLDEWPPNRLRTREANGEIKRMDADEWERQRQSAATEIAKTCSS